MATLQMSLCVHTPPQSVSFSRTLTSPNPQQLFLRTTTLATPFPLRQTLKKTPIRMGGGPRTYPGGVSKWQWKRMQAKKAKQLLKARLCRERQIYEMRKRAELKAAVSELERPWEAVEKAPKIFSVSADEQLKVLADRFQRPQGFDMWTERDGPQVFATAEGIPSARFFPKGVVHSVKPYGRIGGGGESDEGLKTDDDGERMANLDGGRGSRRYRRRRRGGLQRREGGSGLDSGLESKDSDSEGSSFLDSIGSYGFEAKNEKPVGVGGLRREGDRGRNYGGLSGKGNRQAGLGRKKTVENYYNQVYRSGITERSGSHESGGSSSEVYEISLQKDGTYGI